MPSKLTEPQKEALRSKLCAVLLEMRSAYLRAGANPLKHWDQMRDRLRAAVRQTATVKELLTSLGRRLKIDAPSSALSSKIEALDAEAMALHCQAQFLQLIEDEELYLFARIRAEADDRREQAARAALAGASTQEEAGHVGDP